VALDTNISLALRATLTGAAGQAQPQQPLNLSRLLVLSSGVAAGQADRLWAPPTRTLIASANEDLDLAGVLTDAFGATLTIARVKALYIAAAAGNTNNVVVGAAAANPWAALLSATGTVTLRPGAFVLVGTSTVDATGYAVTAGTGDLLRVTNSAGVTSVSYDIAVIGTSA
jgi:hypothetical protein